MPLIWPLNLFIRSRNIPVHSLDSSTLLSPTARAPPVSPRPSCLRRFFTRTRVVVNTRPTTETTPPPSRDAIHSGEVDQGRLQNGVTEVTPVCEENGVTNTANGTDLGIDSLDGTNGDTESPNGGRGNSGTPQDGRNDNNGNNDNITERTNGQSAGKSSVQSTTNAVPTNTTSVLRNRHRLAASWSFRSMTGITDIRPRLRPGRSLPCMTVEPTSNRFNTINDEAVLEAELQRYEQNQDALTKALEDVEAVSEERDWFATLAENRRKECDAVRLLYIKSEGRAVELAADYEILDSSYDKVKKEYQKSLWEQDEWEAEESDAMLREQVELQREQLRGVGIMLQGIEKMVDQWIEPSLAIRDPEWYRSPDGTMFVVLLQKIRDTRRELANGEDANWPQSASSSDGSAGNGREDYGGVPL